MDETKRPAPDVNQSKSIDWNPFPARRLIALSVLALTAIYLFVVGNLKDAWYLLFAIQVMYLLENCLDIFEDKFDFRTGVFNSKMKYFVFFNGGSALVWMVARSVVPGGIVGQTGLLFWLGVLSLNLLTGHFASGAAIKRPMRVK